jgi:SAM-dependent methyltransferase
MANASSTFTGPQYYDEYLGPLTFGPFAAELARRLPHEPPGPVLELACGTGLVTSSLRERLHPALKLVATDLSKPMVDYARSKHRALSVEWQEADAMNLPFADASFGAAVCGFGLMFLPDRLAGLKEARRVLVKEGWLLLSVWDRIEENPHAQVNAGVIEALFPGDAEMRFRVPYDLHDAGLLRSVVADAGFTDIRIDTQRIPIEAADPQSLAVGQIKGTPRSVLIEKRGVSVDLVIEKVAAALKEAGGNPYSAYGQALIVQARAG